MARMSTAALRTLKWLANKLGIAQDQCVDLILGQGLVENMHIINEPIKMRHCRVIGKADVDALLPVEIGLCLAAAGPEHAVHVEPLASGRPAVGVHHVMPESVCNI